MHTAPRPDSTRALAWILLAALGLRGLVAWRNEVIFNDGPAFLQIAQWMQQGDWNAALSHPYHPLYPALVALVHGIVPDWECAAVACSIGAGVASVFVIHRFLRGAYGEQVAWIGAWLLAMHPYAVRFSADVQSDTVYLALFLAALTGLHPALRDQRPVLAFVAGLFAGLAYLTRPEGVGPVVVGMGLAGVAVLRGRWAPGRALGWAAALAAGLALTAGPYVVALRALGGEWTLTRKKSLLELAGLGRGPSEAEYALRLGETDLPLWLLALAIVVVGGALIAGLRSLRIGRAGIALGVVGVTLLAAVAAPAESAVMAGVVVSTLRPELLVLVALGFAVGTREVPGLRTLFVASVLGLYAAVLFGLLLVYGYVSRRHALPPVVLLLGPAALGVPVMADALGVAARRVSAARPSQRFWIVVVLLVVTAIALPKGLRDHRSEELAGRRAADWLAPRVQPPAVLASGRSKLGYYARLDWRPLRASGGLRPLAELQAEGVRYLIVEGETVGGTAAGPDAARLQELHRETANGREAVVYELLPAAP